MGMGERPEIEDDELWDLEYGIILNDNFKIKPIPIKKGCKYYFYDPNKKLSSEMEGKSPLELTEASAVGKEIKKHIDPNGQYNKTTITRQFDSLKKAMNSFVDEYTLAEQEAQRMKREEELAQNKSIYEKGMEIFESTYEPLVYIASLTDWYTAGERINTMIAFLCYCSQVILKNPISVIGLGEGSSGKTFIETTALDMIPAEFILYEKRPTLASMFRRAETNSRYYDGKIVVYGDLGGDSDHDEVEETKNLLKELQTDGFVSRPIMVKVDGDFEVVDLTLIGYPCLTYTTVPNYDFDSQELSRSFTFTPRTNNRHVFNSQRTILELKGGKTQQVYGSMIKLQEDVQLMVYGLRNKFNNISIVNPYSESILMFIGESEYYKRDYDKYNSILKVITAFNSKNRQVFEINDNQIIFTEPEDIQYFVSLFAFYKSSITHNLSRKATEIYEDILSNSDLFQYKKEDERFDLLVESGFTVNDYMEHGNIKLSKKSIRRYVSELNENGYLKIIGKSSRSNIYTTVADSVEKADWNNLYKLSDEAIFQLKNEYPEDVVNYILKVDNEFNEEVSILNQHANIDKPNWVHFDI